MVKQIWLFALLLFVCLSSAHAESMTAAELIEKARSQSREIEELKKVMESPDRNLRLSAFELMMNSDNPIYRELAIESGLASTDSLLRSQALKATVFNMDALYVDLTVDENAPDEAQEKAKEALAAGVPRLIITIRSKDPKNDSMEISATNGGKAEIQGVNYVFQTGYEAGTLTLQDGALLQGPLAFKGNRYIGAAKLR
ncbi:hypothetical protein [Salinisphaera orenii]|uniref:Uncharacterized protein n=1 Tax=Salinisphaera orenii YIM 95161 TaxID=1051139 RepID=A0A423QB27_9GAMM|nr:hypothetical protein [Salinisphaera halophila]ROO37801.1 hypothetical protein SAHL_00800 [Salinisphaera halophila YIM 95161]